jgi:EAL domain-containing protein (putative c-di-GMP-specific phosphodiesterase class I)
MIVILSGRTEFAVSLRELLKKHGVDARHVKPDAKDAMQTLYAQDVVAAVVDRDVPGLPEHGWLDMLTSLGRRVPLVVVGTAGHATSGRPPATITFLEEPSPDDVLGVLDACGAIGISHRKLNRDAIPIFNPQVPLHMLQNNGALSVIAIDASSFRKIAIEYGSEVYHRVQECFNHLLFDLWGTPGCFRAADILCRRSLNANTYYIFLEQSRSASAVPAPGILEKLADRLVIRLQNAFWREIFVERSKRILPDCINMVPEIAIGFGTAIYNPCVDALEVVEQLLDGAIDASKVQMKRMRDRQRELMQTLIQTPGLLEPNYQGVFHLGGLTKASVDEVKASKSIKAIRPLLFGFESLIRVRADAIEAIYDISGPVYMEARHLRPDVLFSLSHQAKVGLELDQACLHQAVVHSPGLPGTLFINVLPRNLYNIERLKHLIMDRKDIMFEVSETEAINNFELMTKARASLEKMDMRIAADDFGRGYSGLEQIIKIKPDLIKLDRSLIQDIHKDQPKQAFVTGLVRAAKISKSTILAEGVELWDEAEVLQAMGIDLIQGYLLHRPQRAAAIEQDLGVGGTASGAATELPESKKPTAA